MIRCKNLALYIIDCVSLSFGRDTGSCGVGHFYLASVPGEVKDPTQGVNVAVLLLAQRWAVWSILSLRTKNTVAILKM